MPVLFAWTQPPASFPCFSGVAGPFLIEVPDCLQRYFLPVSHTWTLGSYHFQDAQDRSGQWQTNFMWVYM